MENIQANYFDFKHRLLIRSGFYLGLTLFIILEILILNKTGLQHDLALFLQTTLLLVLLLFFYACYNKSKYYVDKIELKEHSIILTIYLYNKKLESVEIPLKALRIELNKHYYEIYPKYTLSFRRGSPVDKAGSELIVRQYQIGFWNRENLKNAYKAIGEKQNK